MEHAPRRVVLVGYHDVELLDIACPSDALASANRAGATPPYEIALATLGGGQVWSSCGIPLAAQVPLERVTGPVDTVIASGGHGHEAAAGDQRIVDQMRRVAALSRRVVSVCTGVSLLAAAGLLDGRRAATHWRHAPGIAARYPAVTVDPAPLYVRDGALYTSAGVTSALDLSLALIEDDHGPTLVRDVARTLVTYLHRPGNQAQVSMYIATPPPEDRIVRDLVTHITRRPDADLGTDTLATRAGISPRHLRRLFAQHLDTTPRRYVREVRVEAAAKLLLCTGLPLRGIARRCGLGSPETLRQAFLRYYGTTPSQHRWLHRGLSVGA